MSHSSNLHFDYLIEAQSQKHIAVNEALSRLDACAQWVIEGPRTSASHPRDGALYLDDGDTVISIFLNGGYEEISPKEGWRAFFKLENCEKRFDGTQWVSTKPSGITKRVIDIDLSQSAAPNIESKSVVFGITARVLEAISGDNVTSWKIGVSDDRGRYGSGLWLGVNGWAKGLTGSPITYWNDTPILVSGEGGTISSGKVRLFLYALNLDIPEEI